jgi:16S rRNA (uracil1498-N3)-methyltransferase
MRSITRCVTDRSTGRTALREIRIFSSQPIVTESVWDLPAAAAQHVVKVLRLRAGETLTLFDGRGGEWEAEIVEITKSAVRVRALQHLPIERESPLEITLLQALVRGEKMDWVVQKATELGVHRIVPIATARSVVQLADDRAEKRLEHWRGVAAAACEQCGRNRIPEISTPITLAAACAVQATRGLGMHSFLFVPTAARDFVAALQNLPQATPQAARLSVLVGPEGGLTDAEQSQAAGCGFQAVSLGPRVLRTETAGATVIAVAQALLGDLRKMPA